MTERAGHIPVLLNEVLDVLSPAPGQVYVDATAGLGGHASKVAQRIGPTGAIILNDADPKNLVLAGPTVAAAQPGIRVHSFQGNFAELPNKLPGLGLSADLLLADLGFASIHVDDPARGFSFSHDGPLDMRMDPTLPVTAAELVNSLPEEELAKIIERHGEDRNARRIAMRIVAARGAGAIETTGQLVEIVRAAAGKGGREGIDPATRTFQALRIAVNDEIGSLEAMLGAVVRACGQIASAKDAGKGWLRPGARVAVIAFHSLEDRAVKRAFAECVDLGAKELTRGTVTASEEELGRNPRSRSAKLRALQLPS